MANEQVYTYFPKSGQYYEGYHTEKPESGQIAVRQEKQTVLTASNLKTASQQLMAGEEANSDNVDRLRYVKLFSEVAGMPMPYFWLQNAFTVRQADALELDETFRSVDDDVDYPTGRLEESDQTKMAYAQVRLEAKKMRKVISVPIEDEIRSRFNMMQLESENVKWAFSKRRNELALEEVKKINHNATGGSTLETIDDFDAIGNDQLHSTNDPVRDIQEEMTKFTKANALPITAIALSETLWTSITRNTWTRGQGPFGLAPERLPIGAASKPFPGLNNVNAVVDISLPDDKIYLLTKDSLRLVEGPKMQVGYPDYVKDTQNLKIIDFVGFASVDALLAGQERERIGGRVFSMTLSVTA